MELEGLLFAPQAANVARQVWLLPQGRTALGWLVVKSLQLPAENVELQVLPVRQVLAANARWLAPYPAVAAAVHTEKVCAQLALVEVSHVEAPFASQACA